MDSKDWRKLSVEELFALPEREFETAMSEALRHLVAIGAIADSGFRSDDGEVRWRVDKTHPYWAHTWEEIEGECPPENNRN